MFVGFPHILFQDINNLVSLQTPRIAMMMHGLPLAKCTRKARHNKEGDESERVGLFVQCALYDEREARERMCNVCCVLCVVYF